MISMLLSIIYLFIYIFVFKLLLKSAYFYLQFHLDFVIFMAIPVSLVITNILFLTNIIIPSRWRTSYNIPNGYNSQNPFYVHEMLNNEIESRYDFLGWKNGKLKGFLKLRKLMILWLGGYFLYIGIRYVKPEIYSRFVEAFLDISLVVIIMCRIYLWIFYVRFYKKNFRYPTDKEKNWAPFSFLCQNINAYGEQLEYYKCFTISEDDRKRLGNYQYINTCKAPRDGRTSFYKYGGVETGEIHILAYTKTDLFQERDIEELNKAFLFFWKQYINTEEEKLDIYFSFIIEVEDDNRALNEFILNTSGIMMYNKRYRMGAIYNRFYEKLVIIPLYRHSKYKKQYERMKKDLMGLFE